MVTRRVNGPLTVNCPYCGAKHGPFTRLSMGNWNCSHCKRTFRVA